jgi:hypothetical protein
MINSKRMIRYYGKAAFWLNGLENATTCYRAKKEAGVQYTDEERRKLFEARGKLDEAKKLFTEVWSSRIGAAVTLETRMSAGG